MLYATHESNQTQDAHVEETTTNKTNGQHLIGNDDTDEEAIKISGPANEPDKKIRYGKETQLPPTGHSRRFRLS